MFLHLELIKLIKFKYYLEYTFERKLYYTIKLIFELVLD